MRIGGWCYKMMFSPGTNQKGIEGYIVLVNDVAEERTRGGGRVRQKCGYYVQDLLLFVGFKEAWWGLFYNEEEARVVI